MNYDFSNTRCLIDFDGTIADSLPKYNEALDAMFMGVLTDKHYIEYYKDFGDAYEIIPGCPWKEILGKLCCYLAEEDKVSLPASGDEFLPQMRTYNMGPISAILKVAFNAEPSEFVPEAEMVLYKADDMLIAVSLAELTNAEICGGVAQVAETLGCLDYKVLVPNKYVAWTQSAKGRYEDKLMYMPDLEKILGDMFDELAIPVLSRLSFNELAIVPVVEFCKFYKEHGGSLVIQSGSDEVLVKTMLKALDIETLFDEIWCSPMLDLDQFKGQGPWAYKTAIIERAKEQDDERACFVVGDTKGDAFGASEAGLPFFLIWRGYPADPTRLSGDNSQTLSPNDWADFSPELMERALAGDENAIKTANKSKEALIEFAARVAKGEENAKMPE